MKRFLSLVVACVVMIGLMVPAYAAEEDANVVVSISKKRFKQTYDIYKLANIESFREMDDGTKQFIYSFATAEDTSYAEAVIKGGMTSYLLEVDSRLSDGELNEGEREHLQHVKSELNKLISDATKALEEGQFSILNRKLSEFFSGLTVTELSIQEIDGKGKIAVPWSYWLNKVVAPGILDYGNLNTYLHLDIDDTHFTPKITRHTLSSNDIEDGYYIFVQKSVESHYWNGPLLNSVYMTGTVHSGDVLNLTVKNESPIISKGLCSSLVERLSNGLLSTDVPNSFEYFTHTPSDYIGDGEIRRQYIALKVPISLLSLYDKYPIIIHDDYRGLQVIPDTFQIRYFWQVHQEPDGSGFYKFTPILMDYGEYVYTETVNDNCDMHFEFTDILQNFKTMTDRDIGNLDYVVLEISYDTMLAEDAEIAAYGNPNITWASFSRDPYYNGDEDIPWTDTVKAFTYLYTYGVSFTKVDGDTGKWLEGAAFKLEKFVLSDSSGNRDANGESLGEPSLSMVGNSLNSMNAVNTIPYSYPIIDKAYSGQTLSGNWELVHEYDVEWFVGTDEMEGEIYGRKVFDWGRLPVGLYRITETVAPEGYAGSVPRYFIINVTKDMPNKYNEVSVEAVPVLLSKDVPGEEFTVILPKYFDKECSEVYTRYGEFVEDGILNNGIGWGFTLDSWGSYTGSGTAMFYFEFEFPLITDDGDGDGDIDTDMQSLLTFDYVDEIQEKNPSSMGRATPPDEDNSNYDIPETYVPNYSGVRLPATGGIGTTIFYVAGLTAIFCVAGYLTLSKKRNSQ